MLTAAQTPTARTPCNVLSIAYSSKHEAGHSKLNKITKNHKTKSSENPFFVAIGHIEENGKETAPPA